LISIPLAEATIEGSGVIIKRVSDLGKLLGDSWKLIIVYDCNENKLRSYTPHSLEMDKSNVEINGYTGLFVEMKEARTLKLIGKGWPEGDVNLTSKCRNNMIGIPLKDDSLGRVSNLGKRLGDCWDLIITYDSKEQKPQSYGRNDLLNNRIGIKSDIVINGGIGLIIVVTTNKTCILPIKGNPWSD
jgi:hypothetical protein